MKGFDKLLKIFLLEDINKDIRIALRCEVVCLELLFVEK